MRRRGCVQAALVDVADHADNHLPRTAAPPEAFAEGVPTRPEFSSRRQVDDRHSLRGRPVLRAEPSSLEELYAHRLKVVSHHPCLANCFRCLTGAIRLALRNVGDPDNLAERQVVRERGALNSWQA